MTENAVVIFLKKVKRSTIFKTFFGQKSVIAVCMVCRAMFFGISAFKFSGIWELHIFSPIPLHSLDKKVSY